MEKAWKIMFCFNVYDSARNVKGTACYFGLFL